MVFISLIFSFPGAREREKEKQGPLRVVLRCSGGWTTQRTGKGVDFFFSFATFYAHTLHRLVIDGWPVCLPCLV